jgi:hypothetical protein
MEEHEVFISYSSKDRDIADIVCNTLEANTIKCWIAPRDIVPGKSYASSIIDAISEAKIFLLILSSHSNASEHVLSEVERAFNGNINLITYKVEDVTLRKELQYFLSSKQWLDSLNKEFRGQLRDLVSVARLYLKKNKTAKIIIPDFSYELKIVKNENAGADKPAPPEAPHRKRKLPLWASISVSTLLVAVLGFFAVDQFVINGKTKPIDNQPGTAQGGTAPAGTDRSSPKNMPAATGSVSASHSGNAMAFTPMGEVKINTKDGKEYVCPANCVLFQRYGDMFAGLPGTGKERDQVIPFEEMKTFAVETDDKNGEYRVGVVRLDGEAVAIEYSYDIGAGALVFTDGGGRMELEIGNVTDVAFDFSTKNSTVLKLAVVTTVSGTSFYAPADLLSVFVGKMNAGYSWNWGVSLPLDGGNSMPFTKIHSFEILESKGSELMGWDDEATVDIELNEGNHVGGQIKVYACRLAGINGLGAFNLHVTSELKSIALLETS